MHHTADLELAHAVLRGERAGFDRFFDAYYPAVRAFAERHRPPGPEPRALTARVLERALEWIEGYDGRVPLAALVLAAAHREAPERSERSERPECPERSERPRDPSPPTSSPLSPMRAALRRERRA